MVVIVRSGEVEESVILAVSRVDRLMCFSACSVVLSCTYAVEIREKLLLEMCVDCRLTIIIMSMWDVAFPSVCFSFHLRSEPGLSYAVGLALRVTFISHVLCTSYAAVAGDAQHSMLSSTVVSRGSNSSLLYCPVCTSKAIDGSLSLSFGCASVMCMLHWFLWLS